MWGELLERRAVEDGARLVTEVAVEVELALPDANVAFGVEGVDEFQAVGRAFHEGWAVPGLWRGPVFVVLVLPGPAGDLELNRLGRHALVPASPLDFDPVHN